VELPTYTNIWKIEKRLYKLYDFRLPMPLPVGQVTAFLAIGIPYTLILTMAGMPFSHTWVWLYLLPPGVLAWLVTRPVLEGKRLPELVASQLRYLSEPRTWCRMMPLAEKDQIAVSATVWRGAAAGRRSVTPPSEVVRADGAVAGAFHGDGSDVASPTPNPIDDGSAHASTQQNLPDDADAALLAPPRARTPLQAEAEVLATPAQSPVAAPEPARTIRPVWPMPNRAAQASPAQQPLPHGRPALTVRTGGTARPLPPVERALRHAPEDRPAGWHQRVVVVPGGHRPGKPDQLQRDQARARLALPGPARIVVLGCTAGAGQTTTTLLTGQLLASLRGEAVAVLDIGVGPGSLTEQARRIPRLLPGHRDRSGTPPGSGRERGLQVVTAEAPADQPADAGRLIDAVVARYWITLADPAAPHVPRAVQAADQLVLVAPANAEAAGALAMTLEWLEAHGNADLFRSSVTVLNRVSAATAAHVDKAAGVVAGRCRAIIRVPWDAKLAEGEAVGMAAVQAFTALSGVLISGLANRARADTRTPAGRR